ncbi:MAG: DinB family protein [Thermoflexales bacterium]|nr:DinB family protein [Thermoflexales bacterium]
MLDFAAVRQKTARLADLARGLTQQDLAALSHEMIDTLLHEIAGCVDADIVFVPVDRDANDPYAADDMKNVGWTIGHIIAHTTASAEEGAFLACELARGVPNHGRSRSEVDWQALNTLAACCARLEESRRMRVASLRAWPDQPNRTLSYEPYPGAGQRDCITTFLGGMGHEDGHLAQLREAVRQARAARLGRAA